MSKSVRWSLLALCLAGAVLIGCGDDTPDNGNPGGGTGTFQPGQWHLKVTTSGVGATGCSFLPTSVVTVDTVVCSIQELLANPEIGIDDSTCVVVVDNDVQVDCSGPLTIDACTLTVHLTGGGKLYSDRGTLTLFGAISSLPPDHACDPFREFQCQTKVVVEGTRTGDAPAGTCVTTAAKGPASLLGVSWDDLKPLER